MNFFLKVNENKGGNEDSVEPFRTFDWFAALIFLVFRGDVSRTLEFLDRFRGSSLARYLWPSLVELSFQMSKFHPLKGNFHLWKMAFHDQLLLKIRVALGF